MSGRMMQIGSIIIQEEVGGNVNVYHSHSTMNRLLVERADIEDFITAVAKFFNATSVGTWRTETHMFYTISDFQNECKKKDGWELVACCIQPNGYVVAAWKGQK